MPESVKAAAEGVFSLQEKCQAHLRGNKGYLTFSGLSHISLSSAKHCPTLLSGSSVCSTFAIRGLLPFTDGRISYIALVTHAAVISCSLRV